MGMNRGQHFVAGMRASHRQDARMPITHRVAFRAQTAGDDDFAIRPQRLANRVQRFGYCSVDKAAGIDHHQISSFIARRNAVTFSAQSSQNLFGIDQSLGAAETDKADLRFSSAIHQVFPPG